MDSEIDTRRLISLVKERPVLWDRTQENYKARIHTKSAWIEIFKELNGAYRDMRYKERTDYGKNVMKKWSNIRDSFHRTERKNASSRNSRNGRQSTSTYVYGKELQFLKKLSRGRPAEVSVSAVNEDSVDSDRVIDCDSEEDEIPEETVEKKKRKRKSDPVEQEVANLSLKNSDRHLSFFRGIIPSLETFDDDEIVEFQLSVLQAIADIKRRKRTSRSISEATNVSHYRQAQSTSMPVDSYPNLPSTSKAANQQASSRVGIALDCDSVEQKFSRPPSESDISEDA